MTVKQITHDIKIIMARLEAMEKLLNKKGDEPVQLSLPAPENHVRILRMFG